MINFLVVGFGNMGCRHAQSLLQLASEKTIWVLEPNEIIFFENLKKITTNKDQVFRITSLESINFNIDFCVLATSAQPRFDIMKSIIKAGIKRILVEKVVFQSAGQFQEIIHLLNEYEASAWCNFVNRYFPNYLEIKSNRKYDVPLNMNVIGGDFGLGCNALHYVDLFEYLTNKPAKVINKKLTENVSGNRRGEMYKEVLGQILWQTESGDRLFITAEANRNGGNEILIEQDGKIDLLNEENLQHIHYDNVNNFSSKTFSMIYTSTLTQRIYEDILKGIVLLPSIQDTENCHVQLFSAINHSLQININSPCPIT